MVPAKFYFYLFIKTDLQASFSSACRGSVKVFFCSFHSAAFPLGGASIIILENLDAFGVFWVPSPLLGRKNNQLCFLEMDKQLERLILLKRLWAFLHSH